jgi:hypothetical protein
MNKPIRSVKNQYPGINAHLHSLWQAEGGWNNFHNPHIAQLAIALRAQLLPMGYSASIEESLQIRRADEIRQPKSDVTIYDLVPARYSQPSFPSLGTVANLTLPLPEVLYENPLTEKPYKAIAIYKQSEARQPIVWIELLSPSNKGSDDDALSYLRKRSTLLESGLVYIEIDYLHETPPTLLRLPNYQHGDRHAHAYRISVLEPRPYLAKGHAYLCEFDVDVRIPEVTIPLSSDDSLYFDFSKPYQKQFEEMLYGVELIDYAKLPVHFERYTLPDRQRIALRLLAVLQAFERGDDLETGNFNVEKLTLQEALAQIEAIQTRLP